MRHLIQTIQAAKSNLTYPIRFLSIDVEDWDDVLCVKTLRTVSKSDSTTSVVARGVTIILDLLEKYTSFLASSRVMRAGQA